MLRDLNIFTQDLYDFLILSLKASYEAVRIQSYEILLLFPNDVPFLTKEKIKMQFDGALTNSKSLIIKAYESSAYLISALFTRNLSVLAQLYEFEKNEDNCFDLLEFLVCNLEKSFKEFQENFLVDWDKFYASSPHGILTILSNLIEIIFGSNERSPYSLLKILQKNENIQKKYFHLFARIMEILGKIMSFATKISAENVSTSLFDNSISKEKLIKEKS